MHEKAHAFLQHVEEIGLETMIVMHDQDTKFTASFDEVLESADLEVKKAAHRSPNTVAFVERFIQTLQQECLDCQNDAHFVEPKTAPACHPEQARESPKNGGMGVNCGSSTRPESRSPNRSIAPSFR